MVNNTKKTIPVVHHKSNKEFMILSALGILFVIDSHCGNKFGLVQIFPYDSFFMPMFVFISGYFFKEDYCLSGKACAGFIGRKCRTLLLPYFFWIIFYGIITAILTKFGMLNFALYSITELLRNIFYYGISFGYNDPSWFIPTLFMVNVCYSFSRLIFKTYWNETAATLMMLFLGSLAVFTSVNGLYTTDLHILLLKIVFFEQFFQLGIYFRKYIERIFDSANTFVLLLSCILINLILQLIYGSDISFPSCTFMSGFHSNNYLLPFLTTVTGISFYLKLSKSLVPILGHNPLMNFISDNTLFIMTHHLGAKGLYNGFLILGKKIGIQSLSNLDVEQVKTNAWYVYFESDTWCTLGVVATFLSVLTACELYLIIKNQFILKVKMLKVVTYSRIHNVASRWAK